MMKILLTTDWYAPVINGVVTSVENLRKGLVARGHDVRVLTLSPTNHSYCENGVCYMGAMSAQAIYPNARFCIIQDNHLLQKLACWRPDVVHSNCEFSTFLMAKRIATQVRAPLVHTCHTIYENLTCLLFLNQITCSPLIRHSMRYIAKQTDGIIVPTEKVRRHLQNYGITVPLYLVPTGIAQNSFSSQTIASNRATVRNEWHIPDDHKLLIYLGRLSKEKRCEELLCGLHHFTDQPVSLLIVGDGPVRPELVSRVRAMNLDKQVVFTGMVPPHTVSRYYHAADLFVSASTSETQGLTYLEALANGLPLLCRADAALSGVLHDGVNGWQYHDIDEFKTYLKHFLNRGNTTTLQENDRDTITSYTINAFAEAIEDVYRQVLTNKRNDSIMQ